ncbi:MAG: pyridoxal-phosphate dependent enzyme [Halioglobus sp.]
MSDSNLLQHLSSAPVLGVSMTGVSLLRLDRADGLAPGNKAFKLRENLVQARAKGVSRLLSFGGAWSNHLHALAAVGKESGFETVGIVRGEVSDTPSAMLQDALQWGMRLHHVSRQEYRRRHDADYLAALERRYGPCLLIPEGGANQAGVVGCQQIADLLPRPVQSGERVVLAVGTGTTLAGLTMGMKGERRAVGISVLKGALDLEDSVLKAMGDRGQVRQGDWQILHDHHCGGYARVSSELKRFMLEFERVHKVPLDPVYTGKALYAVHQMLASGQWSGEIIVIHTGGLQGRRGFSWLDPV